jgi:hypothetical protein
MIKLKGRLMCIKVVAAMLLCASASVPIVTAAPEPAISAQESATDGCRCHAEQTRDVEGLASPQSSPVIDDSVPMRVTGTAEAPEASVEEVEKVEVTAQRWPGPVSAPAIPQGWLAIFWALASPLQTWRILVPLAPNRAAELNHQPDATDPYRPTSVPLQ